MVVCSIWEGILEALVCSFNVDVKWPVDGSTVLCYRLFICFHWLDNDVDSLLVICKSIFKYELFIQCTVKLKAHYEVEI